MNEGTMPDALRTANRDYVQPAPRARANAARERLASAYFAEGNALHAAARALIATDLDTLRHKPVVGRGARLRALEDELDAALAAMDD